MERAGGLKFKQRRDPEKPLESSRRDFDALKDFVDGRGKLVHPRARHDDGVAAAVSFFSDAQELATIVLPELDVEVFALDLQFFRLDDIIHFLNSERTVEFSTTGPQNGRTFFGQVIHRFSVECHFYCI